MPKGEFCPSCGRMTADRIPMPKDMACTFCSHPEDSLHYAQECRTCGYRAVVHPLARPN